MRVTKQPKREIDVGDYEMTKMRVTKQPKREMDRESEVDFMARELRDLKEVLEEKGEYSPLVNGLLMEYDSDAPSKYLFMPMLKMLRDNQVGELITKSTPQKRRIPQRMMESEEYEDRKKKSAKPTKRKPVKKCRCK